MPCSILIPLSYTCPMFVQAVMFDRTNGRSAEGGCSGVFDLWLAKGCVDVAEQDCCRLPLVLTLHMTIASTRKPRTVALRGV